MASLALHPCQFVNQASQTAASTLVTQLTKWKDVPVLLLLSGGTCHQVYAHIRAKDFNELVTVTVLDERFTLDESVNNFSQLMKLPFMHEISHKGVSLIDTRVRAGEELHDLASRMEFGLRAWRSTYPDGKMLAVMGIGTDGHTAGIMRYPEDPETFTSLFVDTTHWVVGYDAAGKNPYPLRATITVPFLKTIDYAIVYVVGKDKATAFAKTQAPNGSLPDTPARIILHMREVHIVTDINSPLSL